MGAKTNRLLMLLVGAAIAGCASQTDRSSSGAGAAQAQVESEKTAAPPPPPPPPPYEPEKEPVQYVDRPLEDAPPPKPAAVAVAPKNEPVPEFPVTKYELPEDEEVEDLGPLDDESASEEQEAVAEQESSVGETTEYAEEEADEEIEELGSLDDESVSEEQEAAAEQESSVGETTEYAEEEADEEIEELGPQEDESVASAQEAAPEGESSVGETTAFAEEEESEEVEDLGTQPDDSGTVSYPEEKRASAESLVGEPKIYADEPVQQAAPVPPKPQPAAPRSVSVNFETEPLFSFDKYAIRADQKTKLDELIASLGGAEIESITVIGHTDRIGTTAYNQRLSERRAASVKNYLVNKGIPADRIHMEGRGKSEPVSGDACNKTRGKKLISCLQPDRRVDVSVSGSKRSN
jgi:outer membrane protein OmpA-like peptidoglycan-associated protein